MTRSGQYSFIGPGVFMDKVGKLLRKTKDSYVYIDNKYTSAEDRYVKRHLKEKGR